MQLDQGLFATQFCDIVGKLEEPIAASSIAETMNQKVANNNNSFSATNRQRKASAKTAPVHMDTIPARFVRTDLPSEPRAEVRAERALQVEALPVPSHPGAAVAVAVPPESTGPTPPVRGFSLVRLPERFASPQRWLHLWGGVAALAVLVAMGLPSWLNRHPVPAADARLAVAAQDDEAALATPQAQPSEPPSEAQAAYLRGREHWNRRTEAGLSHALRYFEQALRLDPRHAPALAGLADTYGVAGALHYGPLTSQQAFERAEAYAAQALALDPRLAAAHTALALVKTYRDRDVEGAKSAYRRALQLDPESVVALQRYGTLMLDEGQVEAATDALERAARLDPVSPSLQVNLCYVLYLVQQERRALPYCDRALEVEPDLVQALTVRGLILMREARWSEAIAVLERARRHARGTALPEVLEALGQAYAAVGRPDQTQALLSALRHLESGTGGQRVNQAGLHLALGQLDEAWACLHFDAARVPMELRLDPRYEALRQDSRYRSFLRRPEQAPALAASSPAPPALVGGGEPGIRAVAPVEGPAALDR